MKRAAIALCCGAWLAACAAPRIHLPLHEPVMTGAGPFRIEYGAEDAAAARQVQASAQRAGEVLLRWGRLRDPVALRVLPSHQALEDVLERHGYTWLRAWARYDEVLIQSPRTWSDSGATQEDVDELVLHELTHCLMYQLAGDRGNWAGKEIPIWFREGMATVTASQGQRWPPLDEVARFYAEHPDEDLIARPGDPYEPRSELWNALLARLGFQEPERYREVYGAAFHAFRFLDERHGDAAVRALLAALHAGATFDEAFARAFGGTPDAFAAEFRHYVLSTRAGLP